MNLFKCGFLKQIISINDAMLGYAVPPLETAGTVDLMILTGTIASLAVALGWS